MEDLDFFTSYSGTEIVLTDSWAVPKNMYLKVGNSKIFLGVGHPYEPRTDGFYEVNSDTFDGKVFIHSSSALFEDATPAVEGKATGSNTHEQPAIVKEHGTNTNNLNSDVTIDNQITNNSLENHSNSVEEVKDKRDLKLEEILHNSRQFAENCGESAENFGESLPLSFMNGAYKLSYIPVMGDGNCLYRCVSQHLFGDENQYKEIKSRMISMLWDFNQSKELWQFYAPDSDEYFKTPNRESYLDLINNDGQWGGEFEIRAMEKAFNLKINVHRCDEIFVMKDDLDQIHVVYLTGPDRPPHYDYLSVERAAQEVLLNSTSATSTSTSTISTTTSTSTNSTTNSRASIAKIDFGTRSTTGSVSKQFIDQAKACDNSKFQFYVSDILRSFSVYQHPDDLCKRTNSVVSLFIDSYKMAYNDPESLYHYNMLSVYINYSHQSRFAVTYCVLQYRHNTSVKREYVLVSILETPCRRRDYAVYVNGEIKIFKESEFFEKFVCDPATKITDIKTVYDSWMQFNKSWKYDPARHSGRLEFKFEILLFIYYLKNILDVIFCLLISVISLNFKTGADRKTSWTNLLRKVEASKPKEGRSEIIPLASAGKYIKRETNPDDSVGKDDAGGNGKKGNKKPNNGGKVLIPDKKGKDNYKATNHLDKQASSKQASSKQASSKRAKASKASKGDTIKSGANIDESISDDTFFDDTFIDVSTALDDVAVEKKRHSRGPKLPKSKDKNPPGSNGSTPSRVSKQAKMSPSPTDRFRDELKTSLTGIIDDVRNNMKTLGEEIKEFTSSTSDRINSIYNVIEVQAKQTASNTEDIKKFSVGLESMRQENAEIKEQLSLIIKHQDSNKKKHKKKRREQELFKRLFASSKDSDTDNESSTSTSSSSNSSLVTLYRSKKKRSMKKGRKHHHRR